MSLLSSERKNAKILRELNDIGIALSAEHNHDRLLEMILEKAKEISNADNGTLYLLTSGDRLKFTIMQSTSLGMKLGGTTGKGVPFAPVRLYDKKGIPNHKRLVSHVALTKESINIKNLYTSNRYDFSGTMAFDKLKHYNSRSVLAIPMKNNKNEVLGVLHLVNAQSKRGKIIPFSEDVQHFVEALASQAAVAIQNQDLLREQEELLGGIIEMLALAIDEKSAHTSNHCQAIPVIVELLAQEACKQDEGYFKDFSMTDEEWYELKVAAWLHDCGKLTTPPHILEKSTKLHTIFDRIEVVRTRLEVIARDIEIAFLKKEIDEKEYDRKRKQLAKDWNFLRELNKGSEYVDDTKMAKLNAIAKIRWKPRIGSKADEKTFFTEDEYENLSIRKGTINAKEREIINNHMNVTIDMLESLPFPKHLQRVPEYAGGHHEKMDGSGFPKKLTRDEMSIPARMMAVADIFEALTSHDRPYKEPKTLSESLRIMAHMKKTNHIDPDIFDLFIKNKVYMKYAKKFLLPSQIDRVNDKEILEMSRSPLWEVKSSGSGAA